MGVNGSGKSTIFNIITGIISPDAGNIQFGNQSINLYTQQRRAKLGIRRSFQDACVFENLTVQNNVEISISTELPHANKQKLEHYIDRALDSFHISDIAHTIAGDISFGQRKLLSLAIAMAVPSKLLLLDEPAAGLQPQYHDSIAKLIKQHGGLKLVIDHNIDFLRSLNGQAHFMSGGQIIQSGEIDSVLSKQEVRDEYL